MRLLVFGSRTWTDRASVWRALSALPRSCIIEGEARGADTLARQWAQFYRVPVEKYPANWGLGRSAGPIRNARMHLEGKPDKAIGFVCGSVHEPLSRGSQNMAYICRGAGTPLLIVREDGSWELSPARCSQPEIETHARFLLRRILHRLWQVLVLGEALPGKPCERASGDVVCALCGEVYYDHPADPRETWMTMVCGGKRWKL